MKSCRSDSNCRSSQKCLCDGDCGMSCVRNSVQCEAPPKAKNSRQTVSNGRSFNSVVTYTCNSPYKLRGSAKRTCRAIGKWDGKKARCKTTCKDPGEITYGNRQVDGLQAGKYIKYWCIGDAYTLVGSAILKCLDTGEWDNPTPKCEPPHVSSVTFNAAPKCGPPKIPDLATVYWPRRMPKKFKLSDRVLLKCKEGYFKSNGGILTCNGPDNWSGDITCSHKQYVSDLRKNLTNFIEKYRDVEDLGLKWDLVKMEIRGFTVKFSKIKARRRRDEEVFLQKKINELFTKAEKNRNNRPIICELNSTRARLEKIMALKTRGTIIRSRARWHEQGERNNKYFLNLEKRNHSRKLVSKLKLPNDSVITNQFDILEEQSKFYKSLYTSQHAENVKKPEEGVFFNPSNISALSDHEQALCEGLITENEAFKALKEFAAAKTPGTDGLSTEFLKFFSPELKSLIVESFNYAFLNGSLSISQRRGIISLIPKKNKDKTILENLRPISLLNVDYKILTKVLANRLEKVLPKIINPDQTGYVKGRYIGENIRLIQDLMFHLDKENSPGIAVFVDFRKAFDTIEWNYLEKALTLFNFGPDFLQWFKTVYSNISSCILNNGHASHFFSLTRGVRQGCPISGLLFVIGLDLLARAIKNHDLIKGITIRNHEIKTTMYADDTTVFLSDTESVPHLLELLTQFKVVSGLEVNSTKTEAMWLGKWKNRCDTPFNFKWPVDPICALGVFFSYDTTKADKLNFDEKLRSMEKVLNIWKNRKLTLIGRINIVKTLALSKLIFNSSNLSLPKDLPDTINNMIFNFIWEGKPPKIKKTTVIGQKNKGGLKMIDFKLLRIITSNLQLLNKDFYGMVSPKKA
ncbi:hypothetical protein ACROYT_G003815 [Oculina patagonica]